MFSVHDRSRGKQYEKKKSILTIYYNRGKFSISDPESATYGFPNAEIFFLFLKNPSGIGRTFGILQWGGGQCVTKA